MPLQSQRQSAGAQLLHSQTLAEPPQPQQDSPLHRTTGCSLLSSKLMFPSGRSRPGLGPWDSPEGQPRLRREAVPSHPQGTETPPGELLLAQRTSGTGSGVGLVPALCSCSCGILIPPGPTPQATGSPVTCSPQGYWRAVPEG